MKHFILTFLAVSILLTVTSSVFAAESNTPYKPLTGIYGVTDSMNDSASREDRLSSMLSNMFNLLIGFAGLAAVVMISYGAIQYMVSESLTSKGAGRDKMLNAVIGLLLVLFTYTILYTINPEILSLKIFVENAPTPTPQAVSQTNGTGGANSQTNATGGNTVREPTGIERSGSTYIYSIKQTDPRGRCSIFTSSYTSKELCEAGLVGAQTTITRLKSAGGQAELTTGGCILGSPSATKSC